MDRKPKHICASGLFLAGYIFFTSSLLQPYYAAEFALSSLQVGMAQAAVLLGAMLGAMCAGWLGDVFGRHRILVFLLLFISAFALLSPFVFNFASLYLYRLINGCLAGMLYPLCAAYLTEMSTDSLARQSAVLMFMNCLAAPLGCCTAMLLAQFCDGPILWRLLSTCHAIPAFLAYCYIKRLPESQKWLSVKSNRGGKFSTLFQPGFKVMTCCLMGSWFLMDVAYYGINFFIPYLLQLISIKNGTFLITLFFSLSSASAIFIVDRIDLYKLQKYGFLLSSISLFALASYFASGLQEAYIIIALFILFNFGLNAGPCVTTYLLSAVSYPVETRASSHGMLAGIAKFGSVLGVLFLPVLQSAFGIELLIGFLAAILFAAFLLSMALERIVLNENYARETSLIYETN